MLHLILIVGLSLYIDPALADSPTPKQFLGKLGERFVQRLSPSAPPTTAPLPAEPGPETFNTLSMPWAAALLGDQVSSGNQTEFFVDGTEFYPIRRAMIQSATRTIDLVTYLWCDDEAGLTLAQDLADAARRAPKVRVRVMIDYLNFAKPHAKVYQILASAGIFPMEYNPPWWGLSLVNEHAMHEKIMIVDGQSVLTGGANLCNEYMIGGERGLWHDLELKIQGPLAKPLQQEFDHTWNWVARRELNAENQAAERIASTDGFPFTRIKHLHYAEPTPSDPIANTQSGIDLIPQYQQSYLRGPKDGKKQLAYFQGLIRSAKKSIVVYAPYYILEPYFERELFMAANIKNISVTVFTNSPTTNDEANSRAVATARQGAALKMGVELWEFQNRTLHAKAILIDDQILSVGSHNFTWRSFEKNGDMNVTLADPKIIARFRQMIVDDQRDETVRLDETTWRSRFDELGERFKILYSGFLKGLI